MDPRPLLLDTLPYLSPRQALDGLTPELADRRVDGAPHSIAEIVAHVTFWLDWFLARCEGTGSPMPMQAAIGWPAPEPGGWEALRQRFLDGSTRLAALGDSEAARSRRIDPPMEFPPIAEYTVGEVIVHVAVHNAHHLGQVVLLRQMLGAWPPPAGAYTW
jgi:uncharacterized damage-inducible protein DinB